MYIIKLKKYSKSRAEKTGYRFSSGIAANVFAQGYKKALIDSGKNLIVVVEDEESGEKKEY